jgi:hypothetical protein
VLTKREETIGRIENDVYMKRFNHELDEEFNSPNALNVKETSGRLSLDVLLKY